MKIKAVFDLDIPKDLVKKCKDLDYNAYCKVYQLFADSITTNQECILDYRFYDDCSEVLFEK